MSYQDGKRYKNLSSSLKDNFNKKMVKLSLDGHFTCPNRDGSKGYGGCIFCSSSGSGDFTLDNTLSIHEQIKKQKELLSSKWKNCGYIAYFQNYTNTYKGIDKLDALYSEALSNTSISGLAIATRPDCLSNDIISLLESYNKKTFLWVELGLQTIHKSTSDFINRQYELGEYNQTIIKLENANIPYVTHLIAGLPGESKCDFLNSVKYISKKSLWGVKLHLLHILTDSPLYKSYLSNPFHILSKDEYIDWICDALELLPTHTIIHRLTGDGSKKHLYCPKWSKNKLSVLSSIDMELKNRNSYQGKKSTVCTSFA